MTEDQWQVSSDPVSMLEVVKVGASVRKLRLFACACCRRTWHLIQDERSRSAVDAAERLADGRTASSAWAAAESAVRSALTQTDFGVYRRHRETGSVGG